MLHLMYSQSSISNRGAYDVENVFGFLNSQLSYKYDKINKIMSQLTGVSVKKYWPSTCTAYSATCPIKGPQDRNNYTVLVMAEGVDCNSKVCK
jgi:hypothetical protein